MTSVRFDSIRETWYHTRDTCYACQPAGAGASARQGNRQQQLLPQAKARPAYAGVPLCVQPAPLFSEQSAPR